MPGSWCSTYSCGTSHLRVDLHAKDHGDGLADVLDGSAITTASGRGTPTVMGHEFSGVVAERGAKTRFKEGTRVVSFPMVRGPRGCE